MPQKRKEEKVDNSGNTGHPERDQFVEGKIGSGYMSTIAGQPHLDEFADMTQDGKKEPSSRSRNSNQV